MVKTILQTIGLLALTGSCWGGAVLVSWDKADTLTDGSPIVGSVLYKMRYNCSDGMSGTVETPALSTEVVGLSGRCNFSISAVAGKEGEVSDNTVFDIKPPAPVLQLGD